MALLTDTDWKSVTGVNVRCGSDGELQYPSPWPKCEPTITCPDPGNSQDVNRTLSSGNLLEYESNFKYVCSDPRKYIKVTGSMGQVQAEINNPCHWRQTFPIDGTALECQMHHCTYPYKEPGAHSPPPQEYNLVLDRPQGSTVENWHINFGQKITYKCEGDRYIENDQLDSTETEYEVE